MLVMVLGASSPLLGGRSVEVSRTWTASRSIMERRLVESRGAAVDWHNLRHIGLSEMSDVCLVGVTRDCSGGSQLRAKKVDPATSAGLPPTPAFGAAAPQERR